MPKKQLLRIFFKKIFTCPSITTTTEKRFLPKFLYKLIYFLFSLTFGKVNVIIQYKDVLGC